MPNKALAYAEGVLGVHEVFEETVTLIEDLDKLYGDLDKAQDLRRKLDDEYADREVALTTEMRGVHIKMTDTRFKSELKGWEQSDPELRRIRAELFDVRSEIQGLEYDADILKHRIRLGSSRVEELGGYLHYLAVVKTQAEKTTQTTGDNS